MSRVIAQILIDLNGSQLGTVTRKCTSVREAQEGLAEWAAEVIEAGFVPIGAHITYVVYMLVRRRHVDVVEMIAYKHTENERTETHG